jgi:hypothetical protein
MTDRKDGERDLGVEEAPACRERPGAIEMIDVDDESGPLDRLEPIEERGVIADEMKEVPVLFDGAPPAGLDFLLVATHVHVPGDHGQLAKGIRGGDAGARLGDVEALRDEDVPFAKGLGGFCGDRQLVEWESQRFTLDEVGDIREELASL